MRRVSSWGQAKVLIGDWFVENKHSDECRLLLVDGQDTLDK